MADRLTQLQDALDDLATQFYASLRYISAHHSPPAPDSSGGGGGGGGGASQASSHQQHTQTQTQSQDPSAPAQPPPTTTSSSSPNKEIPFALAQRELARDLVLKQQQIEYLISVLPGIGQSEEAQVKRLRELEAELRVAEEERLKAVEERDKVRERLEGVVGGVRRVVI